MNKRFLHYLKIVTVTHVGVVLILVVFTGWRSTFRRKPDMIMPVEFMVEVPVPPSPIEPEPAPSHEQIPKEMPKQESKQERKKTIVRSQKRVSRRIDGKPPRKQLAPEEIKKFLARGAIPGDHTSVLDDDWQYFEMVRQVLYNAWVQPSDEEVGDAVTEVSIRLQQDGQVIDRSLVRKSGNTVMDDSVIQAANSVQRIEGLSPAFLRKHKVIIVSFRVE